MTREDDLNTDYENNGVFVSDFCRFQENVNYTLATSNVALIIQYSSGHSDHFSPIWSVLLLLVGLQMISTGKYVFSCYSVTCFHIGWGFGAEYYLKKNSESIDNPNYDEKSQTKNEGRLQSLDTFRGLCITIMIFVNYGGQGTD